MKNTFERFGILPNVRQSGGLDLELRCLVQIFREMMAEVKSNTGLSWKQRLNAWKHGFNSVSWLLYNLPENDSDSYLPDLPMAVKGFKINGFFNPVFNNKLLLSWLLEVHQVPHPAVVSIILDGQMFESDSRLVPDMEQALARSLDRYPRQVFRPTWSGGGEGVFFLRRDEDRLRLNGKEVSLQEVCEILAGLDRYLATEFTEQAAYAQTIYPRTTNTLRMLSLWDLHTGEPFIAAVVQRFGSSRSEPLDNWHQGRGGVCALVDMTTSAMGQAVSLSSQKKLVWNTAHPENGQQIEGVVIPGLHDCIEGVLKAAGRYPFCPLIGWDVVMTKDGFSILEANPQPGLTVVQVHTPLLKDQRTRAFFQHWGLI